MTRQGYIAFDLGAESGRAMLATLENDRLELLEAHRFPNLPVRLPSGYHWNLTELWHNLVIGLRKAGELARKNDITLVSLGVDTWGVDFGLVGKSGQLLGLPFAYRDDRNPPAMQKLFDELGQETLYEKTGLQFMPFNTLYQLVAQAQQEPQLMKQVQHVLWMPDLLHYFFTGKAVNEATIVSTSQMVDPRNGMWVSDIMDRYGLPTQALGAVVPAGTKIGRIRDEVAEEAGVEPFDVITPGSHDTASAVAAVPVAEGSANWAYLSSGTWSLMGAELNEPVVTEASRQASFTNERGVENRIRFLKNISGLWLVQEVRRDFAKRGKELDYAALTDLAAKADPFRTLVDPNHGPFASPGDMPTKIDAFAKSTGQPAPQDVGQYVRCCLESLALTYRVVLENLDRLLDRRTEVLHILGGGGQNLLLNQMTADAIGRPAIVGPYEATAIGNALTQAIGAGQVRDLAHLRQIVRNSYNPKTYEPQATDKYDAQYERFAKLLKR